MEMECEQDESKRLIGELRKRFNEKVDEDLHSSTFDERDVRRINIDDLYVWLFLKHKQKDVDKALEMTFDCLKWRKSFGINDLIERNINRRLFEIGFLYPHNKDKNDNPLVLFLCRLYKKDAHNPMEVKKFVAFGLERLSRQNPGQKVTLIFDMQDSGLANMDMDIIKFVITCFQTYFPCMLEYLIVLEMPWILSAAWKLVKTWLSTEGISKIKFVNKAELTQYVSQENLLVSMGGTDAFTYEYPPQMFNGTRPGATPDGQKILQPPKTDMEFSSISVSMSVDPNSKNPLSEPFELLRRTGEDSHSSVELSLTESLQKRGKETNNKTDDKAFSAPKDGVRAPRKRDIRGQRKGQIEHIGPLVTICPAEDLVFCGSATANGESLQILTITNTVSSTVAFKVKTTSPENYRVRPSSGPLAPGASAEVNIFLQPGHATNVSRDKFLILSTVVPEKDKDKDLTAIWKQIPKSSIMEHRLRCRFENNPAPVPFAENHDPNKSPRKETKADPLQLLAKQLKEMEKKFDEASDKVSKLQGDMKCLLRMVLVFFVFTVAVAIAAGVLLAKNPLASA